VIVKLFHCDVLMDVVGMWKQHVSKSCITKTRNETKCKRKYKQKISVLD